MMTRTSSTRSDVVADDFAAESSEQSSPLADLTNAISQPTSSSRQFASGVCGKRNRHDLANVLRLAADALDGPAMAARQKRARGRGSPMENEENDYGVADDFDDVLAPAKNLLSLLEAKKRSNEVVGLTWDVGQKRSSKHDAGGEWVLLEKYNTGPEARAAARLRPNGVRFKSANSSAMHWYYTCATHADNGCPCRLRVSRPTHLGAAGFWLVERLYGEQCDALANVPTEHVIERGTGDIVDCDGAPAIGIPPTKHCREGHQRGVHRNLVPIISEMRKTGATPAAILTELHSAWINGGLHDKITGKGDLPSQKQLKNFFHRKEAAGGDLTVEEVQRYLQQHAIPSTADAFHALRPGTTFALPFDATMLTPGELQRAQKVHSAEFGTVAKEIDAIHDKLVIMSSKEMIVDALACIDAWENCLPLGGDGIWSVLNKHQSMLCSIGSRSNYWDTESRDLRQEFRVFAFGWYAAECAIIPIAICASVRHVVQQLFKKQFPPVKVWNSDDHVAYAATRKVLFNVDGVAFCPCPVHIVRRITEQKIGSEDHYEELAMQCTLMKHAGSHAQFEHIRLASIDIWARKNVEECIHALELLESKPFHATQSGLPGHVSDNQPIESLQKVIREFVGRKQHNPRSFFYNVLGRLMEHISRRLIVMSDQRPVFTVATMTGYEASMQLHALQAPLTDYTEWRKVAFRVPQTDDETYILPALSIVESRRDGRRSARMYQVKVQLVEEGPAMNYYNTLVGVPAPHSYDSTNEIKAAIGAYNMIKKVTDQDVAGLPRAIATHMLQNKWMCNCLEFMRRVQCGHTLYGRFADHPDSPRWHAETLLRQRWCKAKSLRKKDLPGLRPKAREDENVELGKYENIDRLRPKRRNTKGVITPAPRKDSSKLVRSPLSPDYINRTVTRSAQGLPTPSKSNSLQELAGIVAMSNRGQGDITSALESWARKIKLQSGIHGGIDEFCEEILRNGQWQFHPWYLAHFFNLGDENELPRIFRQPSGDALQYKAADCRTRRRFIEQYTDSHTCPKLTNANMYEICSDSTWLANYHVNPILDCIQFDLRAMGRRCSIVGPILRESELMTTGRVAVEQDYRNALSMTSHGRNARWYESDDIFFVWQNGARCHWFAYHFKYERGSWTSRRYDSMQVLRSHKFNAQHVPLPPDDKEEVEKLGQLLTFAVREWHRTQPENDEAASKHKALEAKVRFDSKTWPPQQVDGSSCGVLTVYNITLAAMGIAISPKLYVTHCGEQHLRNKLVHALRDIKNVDSRYWYANVKDPLHVYYDELELDTSIWCLSG